MVCSLLPINKNDLSGHHLPKIRVPTGTGKHGKWLKKIPCTENSWNLKNDEISWKIHGILL